MDVKARAGIDIYGTALRYAEVEQREDRYYLLRMGRLDFDFDLVEAVLEADTASLEALTDALTDVFAGSDAARLHVTLHPPHCYSFFTPLPAEVPKEARKERLLKEAALLTRTQAPQPLRLTADPVFSEPTEAGGHVEWYHVLALKERLHTHFDRVFRMLPQSKYRMTLSMHAVATAIERIEQHDAEARAKTPYSLAVGWYPSHVEYTLCRRGRWYFSHYTEATTPADCAYFAALLLHRLHLSPTLLGRLYVYGTWQDLNVFAPLGDLSSARPELLDPLQRIAKDEHSLTADQPLSAFAPCLGATL